MKYLLRTRKWISIFAIAVLIMASFGIVFSTPEVRACEGGNEGLTPGWWKNHTDLWGNTYYPDYAVRWIFWGVYGYSIIDNATVIEALNFKGGKGIEGAVRILLRAAVAAALSVDSDYVAYPVAIWELVNMVNEALAPGGNIALADRDTILA